MVLEPRNEIVREVFNQRVLQGKRLPCVFTTTELDGEGLRGEGVAGGRGSEEGVDIQYSVKVAPEKLNEFSLSIKVPNFSDLKK